MARPLFIIALVATWASGAWAQTGSRLEFDERLLKGQPAKARPQKNVKVEVPPNTTAEQLMKMADRRVKDANTSYHQDRSKSDAKRAEAAALYRHAQKRFTRQKQSDMALFAKAEAYRQDGEFKAMIQTHKALISAHPSSPIATNASLAIGNYYFDRGELTLSRQAFERVASRPASAEHDLANYMLAWIAVNHDDCALAVERFMKVVRSTIKADSGTPTKDLREEAVVDMTYCYSNIHKGDRAVAFFSSAPVSKLTKRRALKHLANRYAILDRAADAVKVFQKLLTLEQDQELRREYSDQISELKKRISNQGAQRP